MLSVDVSILSFLNSAAQRSIAFDSGVVLLAESYLFKGGVMMAMLWWGWFHEDADIVRRRQAVLATLIGCFIALAVARFLAAALPFRLRPLGNPALDLRVPHGISPQTGFMQTWSAFPSDHATFFAGFALGIGYLSRRLGIMAMVYMLVAICLPRIYLGFHYPTDVLGGVLVGVGIVWLIHRPKIKQALTRPGLHWLQQYPGVFYACFFLLSFEIAVLLEDIRRGGTFLRDMLEEIIKRLW